MTDRAIPAAADVSAEAWFLRGNSLLQMGQLAPAAGSYQRAIELQPAFPEAYNNLAAAQRARKALPDALSAVDRALALRPVYPKALNNRGLILLDCHQGSDAVDSFRRALAIEAKFPEAWHNLGLALMQLRRYTEARDAFAALAAVAPQFPHVAGDLMTAKLHCCDWKDFDAAVEHLIRAVQLGRHAAVPLTFMCVCGSSALQLQCAQLYTAAHFPPAHIPPARIPPARIPPAGPSAAQPSLPLSTTPRLTHDRIRLAYLSGDFGEHPITHLLAGVFEHHDRSRFDTIALSWNRRDEGPARRRVEAAFSQFIDVTAADDSQVAELMRRLEVDIAVDLTGHTLGQRTGILARRAAPVQVNFLGLPATMGAPYVDYLIADRFLVPEEQWAYYSERIVWLPDGYQPNDDRRRVSPPPQPRAAFGLPQDAFVFCSFNRNTKMNPAVFDVWMRILRAVPGSVLWLLASHPGAEANLRREAAARAVDPGRLVFAGDLPYAEYLARYAHADLFLDTAPFNGGATVSDALWMSLPVLTCAGESFSARMAGSLLGSLGFPELGTQSMLDYEAAAVRMASDSARLASMRSRLAQMRSRHAFFDTERYCRHLEAAYQIMWQNHESGREAAPFAVPPRAQPMGTAVFADLASSNNGPMNLS